MSSQATNPVISSRANLSRAEEKSILQVLATWFKEQPVRTSLHPGSQFALHPFEAEKIFWDSLFKNWDTSSEPQQPSLRPATFEETACVIGLVRNNLDVDRSSDPSVPAPGATVYCQPVIDRRIGFVNFLFRTKNGYRLQHHNINFYLERLVTSFSYLKDSMLHCDENERVRITRYNMALAIAISRKRLRLSITYGRRVPADDLARLEWAHGFKRMNLAWIMYNDSLMRQGLRRLAHTDQLVQSLDWNNEEEEEGGDIGLGGEGYGNDI